MKYVAMGKISRTYAELWETIQPEIPKYCPMIGVPTVIIMILLITTTSIATMFTAITTMITSIYKVWRSCSACCIIDISKHGRADLTVQQQASSCFELPRFPRQFEESPRIRHACLKSLTIQLYPWYHHYITPIWALYNAHIIST